tara:strand:- start:25 stop:384 length:360 start_codon:yes stop_codon:yes gene_type:complete
MAVKSNVRFSDFPDYVEDSSVIANPVVDVFRGTGNVTAFQIVNGSADAWFKIFDSKDITMSPSSDQTEPVVEIFVKASTTLVCSCDLTFSTAVSYAATNFPQGTDNPDQTVALTLMGDP